MLKDQFIILAAGQGTRLNHPKLPKVLVPFSNKPLIGHLLSKISRILKSQKPILVVGFMAEKVMQALGSRYDYVLQEEQLGTAHAVKCAKKNVNAENVLILYGDMPFITEDSLRKLMRLHHDKEAKITMFTAKAPNFKNEFHSLTSYGRIIRNFKKEIVKITEYKDANENEKQIKEVNPGIYIFKSEWLWKNINKIKNKNIAKEYYLTDIIEIAILEKTPIYSLEIPAREVIGINTNEDLMNAEKLI